MPSRLEIGSDLTAVKCARCQSFELTGSARAEIENAPITAQQRAFVSGWIAENAPGRLNSHDLKLLLQLRFPTTDQRIEKLLRALIRCTEVPGRPPQIEGGQVWPFLEAASYSQDQEELDYYLKHLHGLGYVEAVGLSDPPIVTVSGFQFIESLEVTNRESRVGFCAMWFSPDVLPLWTDCIEPAITKAGYDAKRIDRVEHNNRIDEEILAWIRRSRFVVSDLTGHRAGVYFEAGFAMGLGLPVVWMVRGNDADDTHFDNRQYNRIEWTADELATAEKRLFDRIVATIGPGPSFEANKALD
jgi:hypothetical protein